MSFEPKQKVELDPPKDDVISLDYLSKCDGTKQTSSGRDTNLTMKIQANMKAFPLTSQSR